MEQWKRVHIKNLLKESLPPEAVTAVLIIAHSCNLSCTRRINSLFSKPISLWPALILLWHDAWKLQSANCWAGLRWARSRGNTEGAAAGRRIVGTRFHSNEYDWRSNALHTESRGFLGNAYRNVSVHTATNIQSTVTAKNAVTLLLKEVISTRFANYTVSHEGSSSLLL
jgi:hypothetical protein